MGRASHSDQRRKRRPRGRFGGGESLATRGVIPDLVVVRAAMAEDSTAGTEKLLPAAAPGRLSRARAGSADLPAAEQVALRQVVPVAGGAASPHVAGESPRRAVQVDQAAPRPDATGLLPQRVTEHVVDVDQAVLVAHWARPAGGAGRGGGGAGAV